MAKGGHSLDGHGGGHAAMRERERLFQQLSSEIMREARDPATLSAVSRRILSRSEVQRDSALAGMLQTCVAQREVELRARADQHRREMEASVRRAAPRDEALRDIKQGRPDPSISPVAAESGGDPAPPPPSTPESRGSITLAQAMNAYRRTRSEFDDYLLHYNLPMAEEAFQRLAALQKRYPDAISTATIERARVDLARVRARRDEIDRDVHKLKERAVASALAGIHDEAARALQRLSSLHNAQPSLLPTERFEAIREEIRRAGEQSERNEVVRELLERERKVAGELRVLLDHVRAFHQAARTLPHDDPRFLAAEKQYIIDVKSIHSHDNSWLADLMLELDDLLEDLHDPTGRAEQHVAHFIDRVRATLHELHHEARNIAREERARRDGTPPQATSPISAPPAPPPPGAPA